jgi:hypothetical protein
MHLFFLPSVVDLMGITPFEQIKIGASGNHNGITQGKYLDKNFRNP